MINRLIVFLVVGLLPIITFAQKEITVKDPEIEFKFTKPNGWKTQNDEYYYYVYSPKVRDAFVSIPYVESNKESKIEHDFDLVIQYFYPNNEPGFKLIETGDDMVDNVRAKWAKYQSSYQGTIRFTILYMFKKNGQTFKIVGSAGEHDFDKISEDFIKIIKSIKS